MYTNAQYVIDPLSGQVSVIRCAIGGVTSFVPLDPANSDYQRIMALVEAGELVIAPAAPLLPTIPARVTRRQARLALLQAGLLNQVESLMRTTATREVQITYEDALEWWREDAMLTAIASMLNLTSEQVDALFIAAASL